MTAAVLIAVLLMPFLAEVEVPTPPDVPTLGPVIICDQGNYITVSSPQNQNYAGNPITLSFAVNVSTMLGQFGNVGYSVDGGVVNSVRNLPTSTSYPNADGGEWSIPP